MEWVFVEYPRVRDVFVDRRRTGTTRRLLIVPEGEQTFDLGIPADYEPAEQIVDVTGTSAEDPMTITFTPKGASSPA